MEPPTVKPGIATDSQFHPHEVWNLLNPGVIWEGSQIDLAMKRCEPT